MAPPQPSLVARLNLALLNLVGGALCTFAASAVGVASFDPRWSAPESVWTAMAYVFGAFAGVCLVLGLPLSLASWWPLRVLAMGLALVGIGVGGTAILLRLFAGILL